MASCATITLWHDPEGETRELQSGQEGWCCTDASGHLGLVWQAGLGGVVQDLPAGIRWIRLEATEHPEVLAALASPRDGRRLLAVLYVPEVPAGTWDGPYLSVHLFNDEQLRAEFESVPGYYSGHWFMGSPLVRVPVRIESASEPPSSAPKSRLMPCVTLVVRRPEKGRKLLWTLPCLLADAVFLPVEILSLPLWWGRWEPLW